MGKITNNVGSKFDIEKGWSKRGSSGSFKRTVEVWVFAIKFIFKWLKVKKLEKVDLIQFSAAQSELAITLRDKLLELGYLHTHSLTHSFIQFSLSHLLTHLCRSNIHQIRSIAINSCGHIT
jgi:hypothetical protein